MNLKLKISSNLLPSPSPRSITNILPESDNLKSDVEKYDPPIYSRPTTHFQVCIYKAKYQNNEVAIKMYQPKSENVDTTSITHEIDIYQRLSKLSNHNNCFLKYYGTYYEGNKINMIMEYHENNLMKYITQLSENNFRFTEELIIPIY